MLTICEAMMDQVVKHAVENYPNEACGLLMGEKGQPSVSEFIPCKNIYDEMHRKFPETYPRNAKTAYVIDPLEQRRLFDEASGAGMEVKAIYHSHTDHDAYFSEEDRTVAAPWGEPMYASVSYIVVSVWDRKFKEANEFYWDQEKKEFVQKNLKTGGRHVR